MTPDVRGPEEGFSLIELMIAMLIGMLVMGSALAITTGVQRTYQHQLHDVTVEQEGRFALDWITKSLESSGSNPYGIITTNCPVAGTDVEPLWLNPDGDALPDDVRIQADAGIPNAFILGAPGACNEPNEDVTISHNPATRTIDRWDRAVDPGFVAQTDTVFTGLTFTYLDGNRNPTLTSGAVRFVQVQVSGQSRGPNPYTGVNTTFTLQSEVRLRAR
jgi:Tfp pilus assembly protein PilW